ncbi:polymorphic toxin type 15 domain-containing protein [Cellulophaga baltica]|uniref:polymorphic toxin type 15 domain-containing protein n=1 Tax=Cellulophaga baltica TaxID=76594 RepID=UPI0004009E2C|nr:polymorphic toxin type 15 domain-containing protein [Cellulophaga baltica]
MSGKKYVPEGVYLVCDKGAKPSELKILYYEETFIYGEKIATSADKIFSANFDPFGACACANGSPCTAPVTDWTNVTDGITLNGNDLLLEDSELPCTLGGNIKIFFSLAAATAAVPKPEKNFFEKMFDALPEGIFKTYVDFEIGVAQGLWKGLKGTVTGIVDLVVWSGKHTLPYIILNPQGFKEQLEKDKKTLKAIGNVAEKAGTWAYRNSAVNMLNDPSDYIAAQQENSVMAGKLMEKASNMSTREWGDVTGQIFFEVALEVGTAGVASTLTAVKAADRSLDVIKTVNALENATDGIKVLESAEDILDGGRTIKDGTRIPMVEELGDVVHLINRIKKITSKPFKWNPNHNFDEFIKQLRGQEAGLNNLTVDDFIKNRDEYLKNGRSNSASKAQRDFREKAHNKRIKENRKKGMSYDEAKLEADEWMDTQAALHDPDQVAGGFGDNVTGMGDRDVNSSLGSQWKDKIDDLDSQVREAAKDMTEAEKKSTYLNIELPNI